MRDTNLGFPPLPPSPSPAPEAAATEPSPKRRRVGESTSEPATEMREEALERLRGVVRDSVGKHLYTSAIFLADKVAAATGDPADVYMLAQALFLGRHYRRALHLLNNSRLLRDLRFRFLAAKCLVMLLTSGLAASYLSSFQNFLVLMCVSASSRRRQLVLLNISSAFLA
jgi:anaphase-promoting complex subunit 6